MPRTLRIPSAPGERVFASPQEIFGSLQPDAQARSWVLWGDFWMTAAPDADLDVLALEERVRAAAHGVEMTWNDLDQLLAQLLQVIDGTLIGRSPGAELPAYPETGWQEIHRTHDLVVTADDSTFWWVTAPEEVIARVRARFPHVEEDPLY